MIKYKNPQNLNFWQGMTLRGSLLVADITQMRASGAGIRQHPLPPAQAAWADPAATAAFAGKQEPAA